MSMIINNKRGRKGKERCYLRGEKKKGYGVRGEISCLIVIIIITRLLVKFAFHKHFLIVNYSSKFLKIWKSK